MEKINSHVVIGSERRPRDFVEELLEDEQQLCLSTYRALHKGTIRGIPSTGMFFAHFAHALLLGKERQDVIRPLYDCAQILAINLGPYTQKERGYHGWFQDLPVFWPYEGKRLISTSEWLDAFAVTFILRDPFQQGRMLLDIEESDIDIWDPSDPDATGGHNDVRRVLFRLFRAFWITEDIDIHDRIRDMVTYSSPEYVGGSAAQDMFNYLYLPLAELLIAIHRDDRATKYPEKLRFALECHKKYYTEIAQRQYEFANADFDTKGYIALCITGLAAYAYDNYDLEPNIESGYMPLWLVKGEFPSYEEAFPEISPRPPFEEKNITLSLTTEEPVEDWHPIWLNALRWIKQQPDMPHLFRLGDEVEEREVAKSVSGAVVCDVEGDKPGKLMIFSIQPVAIANPEQWLAKMKQRWADFAASQLAFPVTDVSFHD
ncbi:Imm49 family immunity protein [Photobacterium sp. 53610]|uniref:Imm49 family immunity protein n=1 Tax=Photobacterium sp. 53610 TaxID=3102789 RepID=UPI002ED98E95